MIEKVNIHQIQSFPETTSRKRSDNAPAFNDKDADVSVRVDYASFIDEAMKIPQTDTQDIEKAKKLLISGELEKPENFIKAAKYIVTFGI